MPILSLTAAVLKISELITQIQKVSQLWMAALDVKDMFFMERAYLLHLRFSLEHSKAEFVLAWKGMPYTFNRLPQKY